MQPRRLEQDSVLIRAISPSISEMAERMAFFYACRLGPDVGQSSLVEAADFNIGLSSRLC